VFAHKTTKLCCSVVLTLIGLYLAINEYLLSVTYCYATNKNKETQFVILILDISLSVYTQPFLRLPKPNKCLFLTEEATEKSRNAETQRRETHRPKERNR